MGAFIKRHADLSVDENIVFLAVISIFLPYYLTIITVAVLGFYVLFKTDIQKTVFSHLGSFLMPIFSLLTLIVAIVYKNHLGFWCSLLFFVLFILVISCIAIFFSTSETLSFSKITV